MQEAETNVYPDPGLKRERKREKRNTIRCVFVVLSPQKSFACRADVRVCKVKRKERKGYDINIMTTGM